MINNIDVYSELEDAIDEFGKAYFVLRELADMAGDLYTEPDVFFHNNSRMDVAVEIVLDYIFSMKDHIEKSMAALKDDSRKDDSGMVIQ